MTYLQSKATLTRECIEPLVLNAIAAVIVVKSPLHSIRAFVHYKPILVDNIGLSRRTSIILWVIN